MVMDDKWKKISFDEIIETIPSCKIKDSSKYNITIQTYKMYTHVRIIHEKNEPKMLFLNKPWLPAFKLSGTVLYLTNGELYIQV